MDFSTNDSGFESPAFSEEIVRKFISRTPPSERADLILKTWCDCKKDFMASFIERHNAGGKSKSATDGFEFSLGVMVSVFKNCIPDPSHRDNEIQLFQRCSRLLFRAKSEKEFCKMLSLCEQTVAVLASRIKVYFEMESLRRSACGA